MFRHLVRWACLAALFLPATPKAQVTIGGNTPPPPGAALDVRSTSGGLLPPRLTTTQRLAISSPPTGLIVFDQNLQALMIFDGAGWKSLMGASTYEMMQRDTAAQTTSNFGLSVDVDEDDAIVAHTGGMFFYHSNGTSWVQTQFIPLSGCSSVSISEGFAFAGRGSSGEVIVYEYNNAPSRMRWEQIQIIRGRTTGQFGYAVAISGSNAIVGCPGNDSFYAYKKAVSYNSNSPTQTIWESVPTPRTAGIVADDLFGNSVDLHGNICIIGCPGEDITTKYIDRDVGAAYIYSYNGTAWRYEAKLLASDIFEEAMFGSSVAIRGNQVVVGAPNKSVGVTTMYGQGAAYLYEMRGDSNWYFSSKLLAFDSARYDQFGNSISLFEDRLVIGAFNKNGAEVLRAGAAYLYERKYGKWRFARKITEPYELQQINGKFGYSLSIYGPAILIGAPGKRSNNGDVFFLE